MARPGITYAEVADAACQLTGQGKNPTIEQIRRLLGTGSSTTIANHLREWKEANSKTNSFASQEQIPDELLSVVKGLWERIIEQSDEKIAHIVSDYQQSLLTAQTDLDKYRRNNQRWQSLFQQWITEKSHLTDTNHALEQKLTASEYKHATLRGKYDSIKQQLVEKQERIDELHALHRQSQINLEQERKQSEGQRATELKEYHRNLNRYQQEIISLEEGKDELEARADELYRKVSVHEQQHTMLTAHTAQLENRLRTTEQQHEEQIRFNKDWQHKYNELKEQLDNKNRQFFETQAEANMLAHQLEKTLTENTALRDQNLALTKEKASLEGQVKQLEKSSKRSTAGKA